MARSDPQTELTFEQALAKLEAIVQSIEQGKIGLQESIQQYEEGMKLIRKCRSILTDAEQKIQKLQLAAGGEMSAEPFQPGADAADEATNPQLLRSLPRFEPAGPPPAVATELPQVASCGFRPCFGIVASRRPDRYTDRFCNA